MSRTKQNKESALDKVISSLPPIRDARYAQVAVLLTYVIASREVFHFERTHLTAFGCCAIAIGADLLLGKYYYKKVIFPLSAMIVGLSSSLLIASSRQWMYFLVVLFAILSKTLIKYKGRHFFNPTNFGVVTVLLICSPDLVAGFPSLFSGVWIPTVVFILLGFATALYAKQIYVSLSWIGGFIFFGLIRAWIAGVAPFFTVAPVISTAFLLFTFHMIDDPATVPKTPRFKILFGISTAFFDGLFRYYKIPYGSFYALTIVSCFTPWIRDWEEGAAPQKLGKIRRL